MGETMKRLLILFFLMLAGVWWLHGRIDAQNREIKRLQNVVDSLQDVVAVRQWVDRRNFARLISNVQLLNCNTVIKRPQLKERVDRHEEYWQMWMRLGEEGRKAKISNIRKVIEWNVSLSICGGRSVLSLSARLVRTRP